MIIHPSTNDVTYDNYFIVYAYGLDGRFLVCETSGTASTILDAKNKAIQLCIDHMPVGYTYVIEEMCECA